MLLRQATVGYRRCMKKLQPMSIRLEPDIKEALDAKAIEEDRTLVWLINKALREYLRLPKPQPAKAKSK